MLTYQYDCVQHPQQQEELSLSNQQLILQALTNIPIQLHQKEKMLQSENGKLKCENNELQSQVNILENKNQELINEISDLRQLVKRVYEEGEIQIKYLKQKNQALSFQNDSLSKALINLQNNIETFGQLKQLSMQFEEEEKNN